MAHNDAVDIENVDGHDRPVLTALDRLDEPPSLLALRTAIDALLPRVDLPDVLLEVAGWTGFTGEFTHVSEGPARADDLGVSICAVLVAEACNIGLEPVVQASAPALSRSRLSWVDQNYVRGDTITAATARMVDAQSDIPLARAWGGGDVASADGLRFVVPVRTLNAGPNPRYFGPGRGVTYLNFLSDQFAGFHAIVVPGTLRDSLYTLDGLLEQQTTLDPHELMTDTAGYGSVDRQRSQLAPARLRDEHPPGRQRPEPLVPQLHGQLIKQPNNPVLLDISDGRLVDARRAAVATHLLPRPLQDVPAVDLVIQRVEPSSGISLGRPVKRMLEGTDRVEILDTTGGTSRNGTYRPLLHIIRMDEAAALASPAVVLSVRLDRYYGRLRHPPSRSPTSRLITGPPIATSSRRC